MSHGKMYPSEAESGEKRWCGKKGRHLRLAIQQRYRSCLIVEFRKNRLLSDGTSAFAVLWLQNTPDEQEVTLRLPVFSGDKTKLRQAEYNFSCDLGKQIGSITVIIKFWRGLGPYHRGLASKNPNVQHVIEVLSTATDNKEVKSAIFDENGDGDSSASESSKGSNDSDKGIGFRNQISDALGNGRETGDENSSDKGMAPLKPLQDYSNHSDQLHRHHRGLMQWKGARTAKWMKSKLGDGKEHLVGSLEHQNRDPGIEKEV
ncbi:MAG: hypothetical protein Q9170_000149 [Blastenia crenularia]